MKRIFGLILLVVWTAAASGQDSTKFRMGLGSITAEEIISHISYLASEDLAGRAAGSPGNDTAAWYIAARFSRLGLAPVLPPRPDSLERFLQKFVIAKTKLTEDQRLSLRIPSENGELTLRYAYRSEFLVQHSGPPRAQTISAPLIFAGYGIDEGENGYNDYHPQGGPALAVKGKIVVVVDGFPGERDPKSVFSLAHKPLYRNPLRKADVAAREGALALVVIGSPASLEPPFAARYEQISRAFARESDHLPERVASAIPIIYCGPAVAADIFRGSGERLDSLVASIERTLRPRPVTLAGRQMNIGIDTETRTLITQNVAGLLAGTDTVLRNETVVIGAHYDHVGLGYYGAMNKADTGKVHFGADDNASGTAGLLEIAEALALAPPKRSVLFLAFSGEENGLLGSRYYVTVQPLRPLESTVAMLNCDMIGRNEPEIVYIGGAFMSEDLRKTVEEANALAGTGFELLYNVGLLNSASDQAPFLRRSIPAAFFFTGLHDDYHSPKDVVDKIDGAKGARVARLAFTTAWKLGNSPGRPVYKELSMPERATLSRESKARLDRIRPPQEKEQDHH